MTSFDGGKHPRGGDPHHPGRFRPAGRSEAQIQFEPTAGNDGAGPLGPYANVLPGDTAMAWSRIAPMVPDWMYLAGGTALALHLRHRVSRDLDIFTERPFDARAHADALTSAFADFVPTMVDNGTVNGVLGGTKVQFLDASQQIGQAEATMLAGIRVAGIEDILACKVKVVLDRGELRDYFDLMAIEKQTDLSVVEGIALYLARFTPAVPDQHVLQVIRALGYFADIEDDPGLPVARRQIENYWIRRQPQVAHMLGFSR